MRELQSLSWAEVVTYERYVFGQEEDEEPANVVTESGLAAAQAWEESRR